MTVAMIRDYLFWATTENAQASCSAGVWIRRVSLEEAWACVAFVGRADYSLGLGRFAAPRAFASSGKGFTCRTTCVTRASFCAAEAFSVVSSARYLCN